MIKDRGNKKWVSLMLREHRKKLEELLEKNNTTSRPLLDEQQLQQMNRNIKTAVADNKKVKIVYYQTKSKSIISLKGYIKASVSDNLILKNNDSDNISLVVDNIIDLIILS